MRQMRQRQATRRTKQTARQGTQQKVAKPFFLRHTKEMANRQRTSSLANNCPGERMKQGKPEPSLVSRWAAWTARHCWPRPGASPSFHRRHSPRPPRSGPTGHVRPPIPSPAPQSRRRRRTGKARRLPSGDASGAGPRAGPAECQCSRFPRSRARRPRAGTSCAATRRQWRWPSPRCSPDSR